MGTLDCSILLLYQIDGYLLWLGNLATFYFHASEKNTAEIKTDDQDSDEKKIDNIRIMFLKYKIKSIKWNGTQQK